MMKLKLVETKNGIFTEVRVKINRMQMYMVLQSKSKRQKDLEALIEQIKIAQKLECFVKKHKCVKVKVSSSYAYYAFEGNLFED